MVCLKSVFHPDFRSILQINRITNLNIKDTLIIISCTCTQYTNYMMTEITIVHPSGARASIHPFGATLTSYQTSKGRELIFVSNLAKRDGSKAIRGGVPLVFPIFGPDPEGAMPQHGFLRCTTWNKSDFYEANGAACCDFRLSLKEVSKARGGEIWGNNEKVDCEIVLTVNVLPSSLQTTLKFKNTGSIPFTFQSLFHTYYKIEGGQALNNDVCYVKGLKGYNAEDKITGKTYELCEEKVVMGVEVDRIYSNPSKPELELIVGTGAASDVKLTSKATVDGKVAPVSVVVWNPYIEKSKALGDFGDEEYHHMLCVEPGILSGVPELENGKEATFEQVLSVL